MSKYADIEQIKEVIRSEWVKYIPMDLDINLSFVLGKISEVPTIEVEDAISENAPSVIPQPKESEWIPCSERLPEIGRKVLASTKKTVFTQVFKGYHSDPKIWAWENNRVKRIEAWQPLPKPWKGAEDYERATEQMEHDALYEPTYNSEDGSM